jgi:hypothetical protein
VEKLRAKFEIGGIRRTESKGVVIGLGDGWYEDFCNVFASLDAYIEGRLGVEEENVMDYNVVVLEHTLCKIKHLTTHKVSFKDILSEI